MASDSDTLLIFKMRGLSSETAQTSTPTPVEIGGPLMEYHDELPQVEGEAQTIMPPEKPRKPRAHMEAQQASIYYKEGDEYPNPMQYYKEALKENTSEGKVVQVQATPRSRADSKHRARDLFCSAHPFRHAYAICSYCHRPFCFEDIIEYQKDYYCIEDIDRVTSKQTERLSSEYSASSFVTSFILIASFFIFLYFSNGQLAYIFGYLFSNPVAFFSSLQIGYLAALAGLVTMVLTFAAGLYLLLGSREGHVVAAVFSVVAIMLFSYQYVGTRTDYMAIVALLEFAAFLSAVHSAAQGAQVYNQVYDKGTEYRLAYGYTAPF